MTNSLILLSHPADELDSLSSSSISLESRDCLAELVLGANEDAKLAVVVYVFVGVDLVVLVLLTFSVVIGVSIGFAVTSTRSVVKEFSLIVGAIKVVATSSLDRGGCCTGNVLVSTLPLLADNIIVDAVLG